MYSELTEGYDVETPSPREVSCETTQEQTVDACTLAFTLALLVAGGAGPISRDKRPLSEIGKLWGVTQRGGV